MLNVNLIIMLVAIIAIMPGAYAYNIPLRVQQDLGCGTASLAMLLESVGENHSQSFYDVCAKRKVNEISYMTNLQLCAHNLGFNFDHLDNAYTRDIKAKDMVVYHALGYDNNTDNHMAIVEEANAMNITLANPWGSYDVYTKPKFKEVFTGHVLRLRGATAARDTLFIEEINKKLIAIGGAV